MGRRFGSYELDRPLGAGAMGEVWRALDIRLARPVALKLLAPTRLADLDARARFVRESRASSALNHPNIVTVFEAGEQDEQPFLAMELIEGQTLREMMNAGLMPRGRVLEVARQVLQGLTVAHAAGIIHRDIKPENLMVRRDGYVKILDFGLAEIVEAANRDNLTRSNVVLGTPMYMSPEQAQARPLDERTDVYSFAIVFYEMLAGRPPIEGGSIMEILTAILEKTPPPLPGLSKDLQDVLSRALEKDPERRFRDAGKMLEALVAITKDRVEVRGQQQQEEEASLVVLPFTAPADDQDVADGITDEIITSLEQIQGLRVIARGTAMRYRGREADPRDVGRELNVGLALEGNMRRSGNRVRVNAGMIDTRSGFRVWGERFDSQMGDIFDLQDEIAGAISRALKSRFSSLKSVARGESPSQDTDANEAYYRGIHFLGTLSPDNVLAAIESLERAVALQPDFAPAHARLSEALIHKLQFFPPADPVAALQKSVSEAQLALRLDPNNPDAHFALGMTHISEANLDVQVARRHMRRALDAAPNHVPALSWMSYLETLRGRPQDGEALARRALTRDPQSVNHYLWLGYSLVSQGRFEEAADASERGLRLDAGNAFVLAVLLMTDLYRGHDEDAAQFGQFLEQFAPEHPAVRAAVLVWRARSGALKWQGVSQRDLRMVRSHAIAARIAADIPALEGNEEAAVDLLKVAFSRGERNLGLLDVDPLLNGIRDSEGFKSYRGQLTRAMAADT